LCFIAFKKKKVGGGLRSEDQLISGGGNKGKDQYFVAHKGPAESREAETEVEEKKRIENVWHIPRDPQETQARKATGREMKDNPWKNSEKS